VESSRHPEGEAKIDELRIPTALERFVDEVAGGYGFAAAIELGLAACPCAVVPMTFLASQG
jgi:hypothetical protein